MYGHMIWFIVSIILIHFNIPYDVNVKDIPIRIKENEY